MAVANRVGWLVDRLDDREGEIERLRETVADLTARAAAAEREAERLKSVGASATKAANKCIAYESAVRQIVNNPTMSREDVQGRLLTVLQDQTAM